MHNLKELIAYVKASPTELAYCSWGVGSGGHLTMEYLKAKTGMRLRQVPYKSAVQCTNDLAAGHVTIAFTDSLSAVPHLKSGRIRAVAASGPERGLTTPDVPTMGEQGTPFNQASWLALFGPEEPAGADRQSPQCRGEPHPPVARGTAALCRDVPEAGQALHARRTR